MKILITGSNGFIGKNLIIRLKQLKNHTIYTYTRSNAQEDLEKFIERADTIIHLAATNRSYNLDDFKKNNIDLTDTICKLIIKQKRNIQLILSSSVQIDKNTPYGISKFESELLCKKLSEYPNIQINIFRLPGVFGKWCRPNYNSVIATFCHNIANNLPIQINDPSTTIKLVYIDDVVDKFIDTLNYKHVGLIYSEINPVYEVKLGDLAKQILAFKESRDSLIIDKVGIGFLRALYATYISYLPHSKIFYKLPKYKDIRGVFVEFLKTSDSGQFSFFSIYPGSVRGGHYHHTKTEKFLVIKGKAKFSFKNIINDNYFEIFSSGDDPQVVETIPGWSHEISNIDNEDIYVILWANEVFNIDRPDTFVKIDKFLI